MYQFSRIIGKAMLIASLMAGGGVVPLLTSTHHAFASNDCFRYSCDGLGPLSYGNGPGAPVCANGSQVPWPVLYYQQDGHTTAEFRLRNSTTCSAWFADISSADGLVRGIRATIQRFFGSNPATQQYTAGNYTTGHVFTPMVGIYPGQLAEVAQGTGIEFDNSSQTVVQDSAGYTNAANWQQY